MVGLNFFLGRQPILDQSQRLVAYELLFRANAVNRADVTDNLTASVTVINHAFTEFGVEKALGPHKGFINADESLLMSDMIELLPKDQIVLELLETVELSPRIIDRCKFLKSRGFTLALDDCTQVTRELYPLLDLVDIIKVDVISLSRKALSDLVRALGGRQLTLLAEKVDNHEQFEWCHALGFHLFQGYYFAKPQIIEGKRLSHSDMGLLKLIGQVMGDEKDSVIENSLKQHPDISFNLLRLANSAAFNSRQEIRSVGSAIRLLGRDQMRRWLQVLLYSNRGSDAHDTHDPLLLLAATRGKMMESLALKKGQKPFADNAFVTGILSLMDTLFGVPMKEILAIIPLGEEVHLALLERRGELGLLLDLVIALEKDDRNALESSLKACGFLSVEEVTQAQVSALAWANSVGG